MDRVVIVGVSTRALAESAQRAGQPCVTVDAFGDLDQKSRVPNVSLARDLARNYSATAAVDIAVRLPAQAAAYGSNLENHPSAVERLARSRTLLGNSPKTLRHARNFAQLSEVCRRAGVCTPPSVFPGSPLPTSGRWLAKPLRGGGGSGVADWNGQVRLGPGHFLQQWVGGTTASLSFVADGKRSKLLGFSKGLAGEAAFGCTGYRYCGSLYPFPVDPGAASRLEALADEATRTFGLVGLNGIDFIQDGSDVFVLEINPRYSASMELIERSHGESMFSAHALACLGSLPSSTSSPKATLGKAVLWARRDFRVGDTLGLLGRDDVRDLPFPGEAVPKGRPVCTVFASGEDVPSCYQSLVATGERLRREIEAPDEADAP